MILPVLSDYHVHTSFSGDCKIEPEIQIKEAVSRGIRHLCFTDHIDYDYMDGEVIFEFDPNDYFHRLKKLQDKYKEQIDLAIGVELGLQPYLSHRHHNLAFSYPFDFIIGSIHLVHSRDPYYPSYFEGRSEDEAYLEYFECILQNLNTYSNFDTFGHLDYVVRYGPNQNHYYSYQKFKEIIDEILKVLVKNRIGLEINTGGYKYGLGAPNPSRDIILRYHELGGRIITFGSDAHEPQYLGYEFERAAQVARSCGFTSYYIFHNRQPEELPL